MLSSNSRFRFPFKCLISILVLAGTVFVCECTIGIHESNIWIPFIYNHSLNPVYIWHVDDGWRSINQIMSLMIYDGPYTSGITERIFGGYPLPSISISTSYFTIDPNGVPRAFYYFDEASDFYEDHQNERAIVNFTRLTPSSAKSAYSIGMVKSIDLTNQNRAHVMLFKERSSFLRLTVSVNYSIAVVHESLIKMNFFDGFSHNGNTFRFGSQEYVNTSIVYTFTQIFTLPELEGPFFDNSTLRYDYKELFSTKFHAEYGNILSTRFVESLPNLEIVSQNAAIILLNVRKDEQDYLLHIPFENLALPLFSTGYGDPINCEQLTGEAIFSSERFLESSPNCNWSPKIFTMRTRFTWVRGVITGTPMRILIDPWNRIIDFLPLSIDSPISGYLILVVSSTFDYERYKFSVYHLINGNPDEISCSYETELLYSGPPVNVTMFYHKFEKDFILISIDNFNFNTTIEFDRLQERCSNVTTPTTLNIFKKYPQSKYVIPIALGIVAFILLCCIKRRGAKSNSQIARTASSPALGSQEMIPGKSNKSVIQDTSPASTSITIPGQLPKTKSLGSIPKQKSLEQIVSKSKSETAVPKLSKSFSSLKTKSLTTKSKLSKQKSLSNLKSKSTSILKRGSSLGKKSSESIREPNSQK